MSAFDGTWNTVTKTPMGDQQATLTLKTEGDTLTGSSSNSMGTLEIENGKVEGNKATWTMNMKVPFPIELEAEVTVDGDTLNGGIKAGAFGTQPITGTRA
jgi:hypothetical protein